MYWSGIAWQWHCSKATALQRHSSGRVTSWLRVHGLNHICSRHSKRLPIVKGRKPAQLEYFFTKKKSLLVLCFLKERIFSFLMFRNDSFWKDSRKVVHFQGERRLQGGRLVEPGHRRARLVHAGDPRTSQDRFQSLVFIGKIFSAASFKQRFWRSGRPQAL